MKTNPANYSTLSKALKVTSAAFEFASDELKANCAIKKQLEAIKEREQQRRNRTEVGARKIMVAALHPLLMYLAITGVGMLAMEAFSASFAACAENCEGCILSLFCFGLLLKSGV